MRNRLMWLLLIGFVLVTVFTIYDVPSALSTTLSLVVPRATPPVDPRLGGKYGITDYLGADSQSLEASERDKRQRISSRYDGQQWVERNPHPETVKVGRFTEEPAPAVIPTEDSDLIVVGKVLDLTTHLANDKGSVYSEFKVKVDQILKNGVAVEIKPSEVITVDREGGLVRYPNGQFVLYEDSVEKLPEAGREYLLFLKGDRISENYQILTGYELKESSTIPLDRGRPTTEIKAQGKSSFILTVQEKLSESNRDKESRKKP
jgi:hypothetical protein